MVSGIRIAVAFAVVLLLSHCAGYSSKIRTARAFFEAGQFQQSAQELEKLAAQEGNDQLLYLMDLGLVYHTAGRYKDAIKVFLKADKLADIKDYTSITKEAATVILNDQVNHYKGEDFEKILINVYLAIDYTLSGQWDDALVECRRVNHKLDLMRQKGKLPYKRNAFAKYLAATLFEARREYNDAFVDYRQLASWKQGTPYLGAPLLRMARKLRATQEFQMYKKRFPNTKNYMIGRKSGEVVVLLEQGNGPVKVPNPSFRLVPMFKRRSFRSNYANVRVGKVATGQTRTLFNIEETAIRQLDSKMAAIMAKKVGGVVVKQLIAKKIEKETDSPLLGFLTSVVLHATDKADLRSWSTLPATLQVARMTVPKGTYDVALDLVYKSGVTQTNFKKWEKVKVAAGQTVFLNYRVRD